MSDQLPVAPGSYTVGPPLPAETAKAPWRPKTTGRIAFFFGPIAGAIVTAVNLRRMGYPEKARKVTWLTLLGSAAMAAVLFFIPDALARVVGIGAEIAFYRIFASIQDSEFAAWEANHAEMTPSNGWLAIGWGIVGIFLFLVICVCVFIALGSFFPGRL